MYTHAYINLWLHVCVCVCVCVICLQTTPFPKVEIEQKLCSEVNVNCSVPSTPRMQNLSVCCQQCSSWCLEIQKAIQVHDFYCWCSFFFAGCDFLNCPVNSQCVVVSDSALCQCLMGYNEAMTNGQFSCVCMHVQQAYRIARNVGGKLILQSAVFTEIRRLFFRKIFNL